MVNIRESINYVSFTNDSKFKKYFFLKDKDVSSRWFLESGKNSELMIWLKRLDLFLGFSGGCIPLQWVSDFVGVSRGAVLLRLKRGDLTCFTFQVSNVLRKDTKKKYDLVPVFECLSWRKIIHNI